MAVFVFYMYVIVSLKEDRMLGDESMLKIDFLDCGNSLLDTRWRGQTFDEDYARLYCVAKGSAETWHGGRYFDMLPGKFFLVPPAANMKFRCKRSCRIIWLHFRILVEGHLDLFSTHPFTSVHGPEDGLSFKKRMIELLGLLERNDVSARLRARGILLDLLSLFFTRDAAERNPRELAAIERFKPVLDYMDRHCCGKLELGRLAKIANYERTYFSALFKRTFLTSPLQYVIRRRIGKARTLLSGSDAKLSSVAEECGFSDAFHLSTTFKRLTGKSPRDFRKALSGKMP
jgi:AraC-like DNA-binding protein